MMITTMMGVIEITKTKENETLCNLVPNTRVTKIETSVITNFRVIISAR